MPKPLKEFNPTIPEGLQQIVNWMLAKKPEERYATPERAAQALQMYLVAESEAKPNRRENIPETPPKQKVLSWLEEAEEHAALPRNPAAKAGTARASRATNAPESISPPPALPASEGIALASARSKASPASVLPKMGVPEEPARTFHRRKRKHKHDVPKAEPTPAIIAPPEVPTVSRAVFPDAEIDVELVPEQASAARGFAPFPRDWIFIGIGAGAALLIVAMAMAVMWILNR
jgi:hypothetical protein